MLEHIMESTKKRAKIAKKNDCPLLRILNEDSLRQVLLRTCASDHEALRHTCSELTRVLDSDPFRRERIHNEWAEVEVTLVEDETSSDAEESVISDSEIHGLPSGSVLQRDFCVKVDGKKAGNASVTLIRRNTDIFHEICDAISQDLQHVSCRFFDTRGRLRVASVKEAIDSQPFRNKEFLYIDKFKWDRAIDGDSKNTWLGATAIRSLLLQESRLHGNWTVAIYIPEAEGHYDDEDRSTSVDSKERNRGEALETLCEEDQLLKRDEWQKRLLDLTELDMQPFFRAGFRQVKETVGKSNCYYVFAVPAFLESSMLSSEETAAIEVLRKPDITCKPPTGVNMMFLRFIRTTCAKRRALNEKIKNALPTELQLDRATENYLRNSEQFRQFEETKANLAARRAELAPIVEWLSDTDDSDLRKRDAHRMFQESSRGLQEIERNLLQVRQGANGAARLALQESAAAVITEMEVELTALTSKVRTETTRFRDEWHHFERFECRSRVRINPGC
jgi:hypothetical protein